MRIMNKFKRVMFLTVAVIFLSARFLFADDLALAPAFELEDIQKNRISLTDYKDKQPVLLFFWTTWCPFCRKELLALNEGYSQLRKDGVAVVAINVGESAQKVSSYIKKNPLMFGIFLDKDTETANSYGIFGVPTYILIDKKGQIVFKGNSFPSDYKGLVLK